MLEAILLVYKKCNVKSFPIDCYEILDLFGIEYIKYSSLSASKKLASLSISNESYFFDGYIYYNDELIDTRIRFSLMHELGHIMLDHVITDDEKLYRQQEAEANQFAGQILAPSMAIYYSKCDTPEKVAQTFDISLLCAKVAYSYYISWYEHTVLHKMNIFDKQLYDHFYHSGQKKFVFKIHNCLFCNRNIFNSTESTCIICNSKWRSISFEDKQVTLVNRLHDNWLINNI